MTDITPSQRRLLELRATGLSVKEAAVRLGICEQTAKAASMEAYRRLGAESLVPALVAAGILIPSAAIPDCGWVGACTRHSGHRGQHGGFRAVISAAGEAAP